MGSINVNRNVTDLFYRYKMPRISAKVEGKGNGIKTVVVNMTDIAKALGRPPTYPTKYFGCELGAQTLVDAKNDRYIVNGSHDSIKLQDLLDGFIKKYVLCPECDNPETVLTVKKSAINQSCKACGFHGALKSIHKLNTYIIKNPPSTGAAANNTSTDAVNGTAAGGKKSKRVSKKGNGNVETQQVTGSLSNGSKTSKDRSNSPDEDKLNGSMAAVASQEKITENGEHFSNGKTDNNCSDDGDDDNAEWAVDLSEDAVRARRSDLTDGVQKMTLTEELEKTEKERIDMFYEFVKERRDRNAIETDAQEKELLARAEQLEIKSKSTLVLAELLFDQNIAVQTMKYRKLLLRFTRDTRKAQKYLITGIEQIIGMYSDILLAKTAGIFQLFYKWDIISEEEFLEWDAKMTKKASKGGISKEIHKLALPFINWLKEAEEESDDSDSDDKSSGSDIEVVYDDSRSRIDNSRKTYTSSNATKPNNTTNSDDATEDFDIDAI